MLSVYVQKEKRAQYGTCGCCGRKDLCQHRVYFEDRLSTRRAYLCHQCRSVVERWIAAWLDNVFSDWRLVCAFQQETVEHPT